MRIFLFFTALLIVGLGLFVYSSAIPEYRDRDRFEAANKAVLDRYYGDNPNSELSGPIDEAKLTEEYYAIQEKENTPHKLFFDTSLTIIILAIGGMMIFCRGAKGLKSPSNKWIILLVGVIAALTTLMGMLLAMQADNSPPWADSSYRGMAAAISISLLFWPLFVTAHAIFLLGRKFNLQAIIFESRLKHANWLLLTALALWAAMTTFLILGVAWFYLIATPFWFYFYASLLAIRAKGHQLT